MQQLITVALNGRAFALEMPAHERLRAWLEEAARVLAADPDREEILKDLEQAIGEKLSKTLTAHKNVVTAADAEAVLTDMGPVQPAGTGGAAGAASAAGAIGAADAAAAPPPAAAPASAPRKLYRIPEGAMLFGVCNGLGAWLGLDVVVVRIAFVLLTFVTGGFMILLYLLMALLMPRAETFEQRAAARGAPFNAQELIDRARAKYAEFRSRQTSKASRDAAAEHSR